MIEFAETIRDTGPAFADRVCQMNKYVFLFSLVFPFAAWGLDQEEIMESCGYVSEFSKKIMEYRQEGTDMRTLMEKFSEFPRMAEMIQAAYDHPRYRTEEHRERVITEFANRGYADCLKAGQRELRRR